MKQVLINAALCFGICLVIFGFGGALGKFGAYELLIFAAMSLFIGLMLWVQLDWEAPSRFNRKYRDRFPWSSRSKK